MLLTNEFYFNYPGRSADFKNDVLVVVMVIGEDGNFFRGGAGPQFSSRRGRDFST